MGWADKIGDAWDSLNDVTDKIQDKDPLYSTIGAAYTAAENSWFGDAVEAVAKPLVKPTTLALEALNAPLDAVKRGLSAGAMVSDRADNVSIFDDHTWSEAWKRSDEQSIGQNFVTGVNDELGTGEDWMHGSFLSPINDPYDPANAKKAKDYYTNTWSGKLSSGAVDVALDLTVDPLQHAGLAAKAVTTARKTIKSGDVAGALAKIAEDSAPAAQAARRGLTPAEADSVSMYTVGQFDSINTGLRAGAKLDADLADHVKNIDSALEASPLSAPTTLFRTANAGSTAIGKSGFPDRIKVGQVITDKGYSSTSKTLEGAAGDIASASAGKSAPVVLELSAPAGTKAIDVNSALADVASPEEAEVLLGRGTKYKVLSEETKNIDRGARGPVSVRYIKAEIVPEAAKAAEATGSTFTKGETRGASRLTDLFDKTDKMSASQMAQLPEFRASGDAGAIAQLFESANKEFAGDAEDIIAQRRQAKADIFGAILGNTNSIRAVKDRSAQIAEQVERLGAPPATTAAYELYDTTDFGKKMIDAYNGGDRDAIAQLTKEHEDEFSRLQRVISAAGSSNQIAAGPLEKIGLLGKSEKLDNRYTEKLFESILPNGLAGKPVRMVVGAASTRVQGAVHVKDPTRGFDDLLSVVSRMSHTPAADRRALMDEFVKAPSESERRNVIDKVEARMFSDAAAKYGVTPKAAKKLLDEAGGRRSAYNQGLSGRLYSAADPLVSFYDPEDDLTHVFEKAFLTTHIENTHNVSDPHVLDQILKRGTNRRMLERWADSTPLSGAATVASDLGSITRDTLDNWGTMVTRVWKDMALMRGAYPIRVQADTQARVAVHLGLMKYFMDGKAADTGKYWLAGMKGSDKDLRLEAALSGRLKGREKTIFGKTIPDTVGGVPLNPAIDDEDVRRVLSSFASEGGGAADIYNDVSAAALRSRRQEGSWGRTAPTDPNWFDAWKRAADQVRTSPTARKALEDDDLGRLAQFVNSDPKAKAEWLNFRESSDSMEEWLTRIVAHNDHLFPTPELRSTIRKPEEAKQLFDLSAAADRKAAKPAAREVRGETTKELKDLNAKLRKIGAQIKKQDPNDPAGHEELLQQREDLRAQREELRNDSQEAKDTVTELNRKPSADVGPHPERTQAGLLEPMPVHGESFSPLTQDSWGARWNKYREGFYTWAADAPETVIGRSPIYVDSYKQYIKDSVARLGDEGVDLVGVDRIRSAADRAARKEVGQILFDATHASNMSHAMRFISPFFAAWEDTAKKWSKLMVDKPSTPTTFAKVWNAPANVGLVEDQEGRKLKAGEHADRGQYIVIPKIPGISKLVPGTGGFKMRQDSLNILFQGDPAWLPGNGPLVQIPANEIIKRYAVTKGDDPLVHYLLPFGITDDSIKQQVLPSWMKQVVDSGVGPFGHTKDFNQQYVVLMNQEIGRFNRGERKSMPDADEIGGKTRMWFLLRGALNNLSPVSIQPTPKDQFYIDKARQYRSDPARKGHWQEDFYDDFPGYFEMSATLSVNETGLQATTEAFDAAKKYKKDIRENPKLGWFFAGPDNLTGEFNPDVNTYQRSNEAGKGLTFRSTKDPGQAVADTQEAKGWIEYNKASTYVNLELQKRGLTNIQQKGAEDLAGLKRAYTQYLGSTNTAWGVAYRQRDASGVYELYHVASAKWKKDKAFAGRKDQVLLQSYFDARNQVKAMNITTTAKQGLLDAYGQYLVGQSPAFEQIWNRTLEADDISQAVV